jgi:hypothetical protein
MNGNRRSGARSGWARRKARVAAAPAEPGRTDLQSQQPGCAAEGEDHPARNGAAMRARCARLLTGCLAFGSAPLEWPHLTIALKALSS